MADPPSEREYQVTDVPLNRAGEGIPTEGTQRPSQQEQQSVAASDDVLSSPLNALSLPSAILDLSSHEQRHQLIASYVHQTQEEKHRMSQDHPPQSQSTSTNDSKEPTTSSQSTPHIGSLSSRADSSAPFSDSDPTSNASAAAAISSSSSSALPLHLHGQAGMVGAMKHRDHVGTTNSQSGTNAIAASDQTLGEETRDQSTTVEDEKQTVTSSPRRRVLSSHSPATSLVAAILASSSSSSLLSGPSVTSAGNLNGDEDEDEMYDDIVDVDPASESAVRIPGPSPLLCRAAQHLKDAIDFANRNRIAVTLKRRGKKKKNKMHVEAKELHEREGKRAKATTIKRAAPRLRMPSSLKELLHHDQQGQGETTFQLAHAVIPQSISSRPASSRAPLPPPAAPSGSFTSRRGRLTPRQVEALAHEAFERRWKHKKDEMAMGKFTGGTAVNSGSSMGTPRTAR